VKKKYFSAPSYCSVPPPPPQRRPTIPSVEPPPLYLTPASPDSAPYFGMPIKPNQKTRNRSCSLSDYIASSCPAPAYLEQATGTTSEYLDVPQRKDSLGIGSVPGKRQLPAITEKATDWLGSSPTIFSLLATDKLIVPKSEETITKEENKASVSTGDFDLFDLESTLPSAPPLTDDLQFEMEELTEGETSGIHAV